MTANELMSYAQAMAFDLVKKVFSSGQGNLKLHVSLRSNLRFTDAFDDATFVLYYGRSPQKLWYEWLKSSTKPSPYHLMRPPFEIGRAHV